jgi:prepilin-type N-terminal cleavage/methylation domain-containing protein
MYKKKLKKIQNTSQQGFTLVELLVTLSVFTVISALTLANYPKFNNQTAITGLAQQIAISIREAQVYGVAVKNASSTASIVSPNVYPAYGIFFATTSVGTTYGGATSYSIFFDRVTSNGVAPYFRPMGDNYFSDSGELVETVKIQNGSKIVSICGVPTNGSTCDTAYSAFVVFRRPNPDAIIKTITTAGTWPYTTPTLVDCQRLDIVIRSRDQNLTKTIQVYSSGQITVK